MPLQRSHLTLCFEGEGGLQLVLNLALAHDGGVGGGVAALGQEEEQQQET